MNKFGWILRAIVWVVAGLFVAWLVAYPLFWANRTGYAVPAGPAFLNWLGDLVLLHWMKNYQTLVAGVLTLLAGAFVVWAALYQRNTILQDAALAKQQVVNEVLGSCSLGFHQCLMKLLNTDLGGARASLEAIERQLASVAAISLPLAQWLQIATAEIRADLPEAQGGNDGPGELERLKRAVAGAAIVQAYLADFERCFAFPDGRYRHVAQDPAAVKQVLATVDIDLADIPWAAPMFVVG